MSMRPRLFDPPAAIFRVANRGLDVLVGMLQFFVTDSLRFMIARATIV